MASEELTSSLKTLKGNLSSAKDGVVISTLTKLQQLIADSSSGFKEELLKGVFKCLIGSLGLYSNSSSRHTTHQFIKFIINKCDNAAKYFVDASQDFALQQKTCRFGAGAYDWLVWSSEFKVNDKKLQENLVKQQALVHHSVYCCTRKSVRLAVCRTWRTIISQNGSKLNEYLRILSEDLESILYNMSLAGTLINLFPEQADAKYTKTLVDAAIKFMFSSKTRLSHSIISSSRELMSACSHESFTTELQPTAKRFMLRNPEIALFVLSAVLGYISLDVSKYSLELAQMLAVEAHSKEESRRSAAVEAFKHLADKCSSAESVNKVTTHLLAILSGSEGKLTVVAERIDVLSALSNMSYNTVSGPLDKQSIVEPVITQLVKYLANEGVENVLVHAVNVMANWLKLSPLSISNIAIEKLKMGVSVKTTSSNVRQAYLSLLVACYNTADGLTKIADLASILNTTVNTALSQPQQLNLLCEAVQASYILKRLERYELLSDESVVNKFVQTSNLKLLQNDKFFISASDSAIESISGLSESLLLLSPDKIDSEQTQLLLEFIVNGACHKSYTVRQKSQSSIKRLTSGLGGVSFASDMIKYLQTLLNSQNWDEFFSDSSEEKISMTFTAKGFTEALSAMLAFPSNASEATTVALLALIPSHHQAIEMYSADLWLKYLRKRNLTPELIVNRNAKDLVRNILKSQLTPAHANALKTVVRLDSTESVPVVLDYVRSLLNDDELQQISLVQYGILKCAEGDLYDTSILHKYEDEDLDPHNMKRENKLYSYKEQLLELELKRELEAKRKKQGVQKKLNQKQEQAKKEQLKIESELRTKVKMLDEKTRSAQKLLLTLLDVPTECVIRFYPEICNAIYPLLSGAIPAYHLSAVYMKMMETALGKNGGLVGYISMKSSGAAYTNKEWEAADSQSQYEAVIDIITHGSPFSTAAFACFFPLIKVLLTDTYTYEDIKNKCDLLNVIKQHADLRSDTEDDGPALLPRAELLTLLFKLCSSPSNKICKSAKLALISVCQCSNGGEGCTVAEADEIDIILKQLCKEHNDTRTTALKGLSQLTDVLPTPEIDIQGKEVIRRLWIAHFDEDKSNSQLAKLVWDQLGLELDVTILSDFIEDITSDVSCIRKSAVEALHELLKQHEDSVETMTDIILNTYEDKLQMEAAEFDNFGRIVKEQGRDQWKARLGLALALRKLAAIIPDSRVSVLIDFYVPDALHDRHESVAVAMRDAAVALVEIHGKAHVNDLLPILNKNLNSLPNSASYDIVRQGVVVLMGFLAKHLDKSDSRVKPIVARLIEALSTPSQPVQESVAHCIYPLVPAIKEDVPELIKKLINLLLTSDNYGQRRGAAYGLAGFVKGLGVLSLKQLEIMDRLLTAVQNKKNQKEKEGALFAFEILSVMLGKLFEPYIKQVLPHLLLCFGDGNVHVRQAADDTAKAVMGQLSAPGVKIVLPLLLHALEDEQWRTKSGSVELLGAMAYCAPKQLSACLPQIVPKLVEVVADAHHKVSQSGATALQHIGEVIKNPEIQSLVPILLDALQNPSNQTTQCLNAMLDTQFVHFIDAPSLALIMPVVTRAIDDRSTETRKMSCQIIGNMYSLTDEKDLSPYLANIMPGLKRCLVDPVPEVRGMSARALGAMVKVIGEQAYDDLHPWLMMTLTSEGNTVNRSGAAQGLSEMIGALGLPKLSESIQQIINTTQGGNIAPYVRDGYIMMFIYLPIVFGDEFIQYVGPILPTVLRALADETEYVRDTALKAGQKIINMYADKSIELLLPELENGLFDENWRIRLSSVHLLGDLLFKLSGVSGKMSTQTAHDDDNFGTETGQQAVVMRLGELRRNRVLSGLYMGRSDTALLVRQASLHVWKVIVSNTPRTLRDILPTLFSLLLGCLASNHYDKREVAARTLGDVVKKLGERVLPEILPILENGMKSVDSDHRQGVCIGLSEIMKSTSREHVQVFSDSLILTVSAALTDPVAEVREAAAQTFDALHSNIGTRALEEVLPALLEKLDDPSTSEYALDGLQQVMAVKSGSVLPFLVPKLVKSPVNTRALSYLSTVAGSSIDRELYKILPAICGSLAEKLNTPNQDEEMEFCSSIVLSVQSEGSVRTVIEELQRNFNSQDIRQRAAAAIILNVFCKESKMDYSDYLNELFKKTLALFALDDKMVLEAAWECVNSIVKRLEASSAMFQVPAVRQALRLACSDLAPGALLPGFCLLKKNLMCLLPVFRDGLLNGSPELKESAAIGMGDAIKRTSAESLKPSVVHITGPLIRVLGDRYGPTVRVAMLDTITLLLIKCGGSLKPFLPQLQTTLLKALNDPSRSVRLKSAEAMPYLISIHVRVDPVFNELNNGAKNTTIDDNSVRETFLHALRLSLIEGGKKASAPVRLEILKTVLSLLNNSDDNMRITAAACLGSLLACLPDDDLTDVLINHIFNLKDSNWLVIHSRSIALFTALKESASVLSTPQHRENIITTILQHMVNDKNSIMMFGYRSAALLMKNDIKSGQPIDKRVPIAVSKGMKSESNDIKQLVGQSIELVSRIANQHGCMEDSAAKILIPTLVNGAKEKNSAVKAYSEYALITLLQLRQDENYYKNILKVLEPGKSDSLSDVVAKNLKKLLKQAEPKEEEFDVTMLK